MSARRLQAEKREASRSPSATASPVPSPSKQPKVLPHEAATDGQTDAAAPPRPLECDASGRPPSCPPTPAVAPPAWGHTSWEAAPPAADGAGGEDRPTPGSLASGAARAPLGREVAEAGPQCGGGQGLEVAAVVRSSIDVVVSRLAEVRGVVAVRCTAWGVTGIQLGVEMCVSGPACLLLQLLLSGHFSDL
jgi:hypothetical protein